MAKPASKLASRGDPYPQPRQDNGHHSSNKIPQKKTKKPIKSNITNKPKSKMQASRMDVDGDEGDGSGTDSGTLGETSDDATEPDVPTLSSATQSGDGEDTPRLTGLPAEDDMFSDLIDLDDSQSAFEGAELDENESGDYDDVDNISESDADDDEVEAAVMRSAEKDLRDEFKELEVERVSNTALDFGLLDLVDPRQNAEWDEFENDMLVSYGGREPGPPLNLDQDPFNGLATDDTTYNAMWSEAEHAIWRIPESARGRDGSNANANQKRVRFEQREVSSSSSSSSSSGSEDPNEAFPDLFTPSDDAVVQRHLGAGLDFDLDFADADSFYDFEDEDERVAFEVDEQSDSESDMSSNDSVGGDTTDDESPEDAIAKLAEIRRAAGRPVRSPASTPVMAKRAISTASTPNNSRPTTPRNGRGPRTGTFNVDPTRAAMTTDADGKNIRLMPPSKPSEKDKAFWERAKTANSSRTNTPPNSAYLTMPIPATAADETPHRPLTVRSTLGSMFNGDLGVLRDHDISGIAEELFPHVLPHHRGTSFTTTDESEADHAADIDMRDYLATDDSDSDPEVPSSAGPADTPSRRSSPDLMDHFDQRRGLVGSFRRNQATAKHFSSLPSHPGKRALMHEFNALRKGKRGAANTPMTPARKKRVSQDLTSSGGVRKNVGSPLAAARRPRSRGNSLNFGANGGLLQTLGRGDFDD